MSVFDYKQFLPRDIYDKINQIKTFEPEIIEKELKSRIKPLISHQLVLVAADHNARMITAYNGNNIGLGNRHEYLSRVARMLMSSFVDGIEATADIIEDLLVLNSIMKERHNVDMLENKLLIGTVNRGGLKNTSWEMDDMCTCYTVEKLVEMKLDGVKFMFRIDPDDKDSGKTIRYCSETINIAEKNKLPIFIESLFVKKAENGYALEVSTERLVQTVGVAAALGNTSARKWLEVPLNNDYKTVTDATTCSILVVPDEAKFHAMEVVEEYVKERGINTNIRGILLGRNVMYNQADPYYIADAIGISWHQGIDGAQAYCLSLETEAALQQM